MTDVEIYDGKKVNTSTFFNRLMDIMKDPEIKSFFKDYFSNWTDAKTSLMFMHTYVAIEEMCLINGKTPTSDEIVFYLHKFISNSETRKLLVETMNNFTTCDTKTFMQKLMPV